MAKIDQLYIIRKGSQLRLHTYRSVICYLLIFIIQLILTFSFSVCDDFL